MGCLKEILLLTVLNKKFTLEIPILFLAISGCRLNLGVEQLGVVKLQNRDQWSGMKLKHNNNAVSVKTTLNILFILAHDLQSSENAKYQYEFEGCI